MAFILDKSDPNGQGMFSKAGRITSAKYVVFQKKAEILENQRKFLKVSALPLMKLDLEQEKEDKNNFLDEDNIPKPKVIAPKRERPQTAPFQLQVSREHIDKVTSIRHPPPPLGTYNPKFNVLHKTSSALFKYDREKPKPMISARASTARDMSAPRGAGQTGMTEQIGMLQSDLEFNPDKPKKKVVGVGQFEQQTSREQFSRPNTSHGVHEERFVSYPLPASFSKSKRVSGFNLNKAAGRESGRYKSNQRALPDYAPNYEFGRRQLGTSGPAFNKRTGRKDVNFVSSSINEDFFNVDKSMDLKYTRQKDTDFSRDLPRERTPNNPLPSFMQKGNCSRLGMELGGEMTLENNNYSGAKFMSNLSSFSPLPNRPNSSKLNTWRI